MIKEISFNNYLKSAMFKLLKIFRIHLKIC